MFKTWAEPWLEELCSEIEGASHALLVLGKDPIGPFAPIARWPIADRETIPSLIGAAQAALASGGPVVRSPSADEVADPRLNHEIVATPFRVQTERGAETLRGAIAVETTVRGPSGQQPVIVALQQALTRLPVPPGLFGTESPSRCSSDAVRLDLTATVLDAASFQAAATDTATKLADLLGADRVSLGVHDGEDVRVCALSHSARFDGRANLIRDIEAAMAEAIDQNARITYPAPLGGETRIQRAHAALAEAHGATVVFSLPLSARGRITGALTAELGPGEPLDTERRTLCEAIAARLGPVLEARRREERPVLVHLREALRERLAALTGPEHLRAKVVGTGLLVMAIALAAAPGTYRVTAPARVEGIVQRAVVAPIDGFIAESRARAGDAVHAGQVLGLLDDTELALEQRKWEGRRAQLAKSYRAALASGERAEVSILRAQLDQADAEIGLLTEQIARTRLVAPFDGIVARGDLSRSLGSPVERGEVLFEVAPLDTYRVLVEVDERDIAAVAPEQAGRLTLTAVPEAELHFSVSRVTPIATSAEGRNHFPVEANLESPPVALRPGMEGVAKIEIERRSLLWIFSHRVVDWLRFAAWSWLP